MTTTDPISAMKTPPATPSGRAEIAARLPHAGDMILLEKVILTNEDRIVCEAVSHEDPANPLCHDGYLPASAGIEYAAQAIALHGVLNARKGAPPRSAFIARIKHAQWTGAPLDQMPSPMTIDARRLSQLGDGAQYAFALSGPDGVERLSGELLVMLAPSPSHTPSQD